MPDAPLRERRRLWELGAVRVDGVPRPKGYRVRTGQRIEIDDAADAMDRQDMSVPDGVRVVAQRTGYMAALFKPAGVHTENIAGRPVPSVENALPLFWPGREATLVNRLDFLTSGIVLVALSPTAGEEYRELEDEGRVSKAYLAVLHGRVESEFVVRRRLDMARRKVVRVLDEDDDNPVRATSVRPLGEVGTDRTLVLAEIAKGARHQIRAHCASAGHPIVGDLVYGAAEEGERLYLHHWRVSLPDFEARVAPDWPEWTGWATLLDSYAR
ncbi:23S rRNA pseudouridine1911/1915/1917 synthase [Desulfobaculum xiamenense]|uniref:23S rRNA pseudouridine1911/1915/1917 synthase n=1 Tax=Desulfobaculum xiamenense TaxID=995050 RepID=A0A846QW52_9BACT|nr:RNA pseudouridine synthase [Desulfobaculum xiamenense]NJB69344.1 23S rRNA pseudouridine1911/1915/1917 synthase [Desulfobaculum xiamenense]